MTANIGSIRKCVQEFDFTSLFINELGWDRHRVTHAVDVDDVGWRLEGVATKRGFQVFHHDAEGEIPKRAVRQKIDNALAKIALEHLIVYTDAAGTSQRWQWTLRLADKPAQYREDRYERGQSGQRLAEKLRHLFVSIDEEERLTVSDVAQRAQLAFRKDKVTKKFYERFDTERKGFLPKIEGIPDEGRRDWYVSIMLNRLMFVYFIQSKGFLNNDQQYLQHKLQEVQARQGRDQFYSFYRHFLLELFHKGLGGQPPRPPEIEALLGDVPYLNGGIFEQHQLERENPDIQIPDTAFEDIFAFFDDYDWHLDDRPLRDDKQINPDVLGYIFEKYINQKQMGAYYTKEDITEYISKNTIIPFLFDQAKKDCAIAFQPGSATWGLLRDNPDRYIYEAVRRGTDLALPPEIDAGRRDVSQRGAWNAPADPEYALPTEWWREHVARRERYEEIWGKLVDGEVTSIDDFITYNLDIRQFAQDVIQHSEGPELVRAFFKAIERVSVLDPTCGSGAFLFAALNVLHPLYDACLERMEEMVFALDLNETTPPPPPQHKLRDFRDKLAKTHERGRDYFISKTIILNNLYGVDIMEEAVEICKLRLFLKLASELQPGKTLEPLPDIDFNIRAGNTLVGFASMDEVRKAMLIDGRGNLRMQMPEDQAALARIEEQAERIDRIERLFREQQSTYGGRVTAEHKAELRSRLRELSAELDRYLAALYGMHRDGGRSQLEYEQRFATWRESHEPFHWLVDFYGIMQRGGFDVIIGNPPYVEYSKVKREYSVVDYTTEPCGNIYAFVLERCFDIGGEPGHIGMIVPLSLVCTDRMKEARQLVRASSSWLSCYDMRPNSLFEGVSQRLTIVLTQKSKQGSRPCYIGGYRRWTADERPSLIPSTQYVQEPCPTSGVAVVPKHMTPTENTLLNKIDGPQLTKFVDPRNDPIYVHRIVRYFIKALNFIPSFTSSTGESSKSEDYKPFSFVSTESEQIACLLNSTLHYWFWRSHSDGFHCGYSDVYTMPYAAPLAPETRLDLSRWLEVLMKDLNENSALKSIRTKTGTITYQEFRQGSSKPIIDEIDRVLARHYGFTEEELDFIVNYDVKYRMGREGVGNRE